jgi:hypothetical protein
VRAAPLGLAIAGVPDLQPRRARAIGAIPPLRQRYPQGHGLLRA